MLMNAMTDLNLSARAYDRILKVARTIADLAGRDTVNHEDVFEAIQYRSLDRQLWGLGRLSLRFPGQIPAYQEYPLSGAPFPNARRLSVTVRWVRYLMLL